MEYAFGKFVDSMITNISSSDVWLGLIKSHFVNTNDARATTTDSEIG